MGDRRNFFVYRDLTSLGVAGSKFGSSSASGSTVAAPLHVQSEVSGLPAALAEVVRLQDGTDEVSMYLLTGTPTQAAQQGSLAIDYSAGALYINTDGAASWSNLSAGATSIYSGNASLTAPRTVTLNSSSLTFAEAVGGVNASLNLTAASGDAIIAPTS